MAKRKQKTESFKVFEKNVERSAAFLRIFDQDRAAGRPTKDENELLRGSLVFAVGALDAYLHDLVLEVVPKYGRRSKRLKEALKAIARNDPGLALRVALADNPAAAQEEFRAALDEWLSAKSFQGAQRVAEACEYVACPLSWPELDARMKKKEIDVGEGTAPAIDALAQSRHDIVHRGRKPNFTRRHAGSANDLIWGLASYIDDKVLARHYWADGVG